MAFVDLDYVKIALGMDLNDNSSDARTRQNIRAACALMENCLTYPVEQATRTEIHSGNGTNLLALDARNVTSITDIWLDDSGWFGAAGGAFGTPTKLTNGVDYALLLDDGTDASWGGLIVRINGVWPAPIGKTPGLLQQSPDLFRGNVKVTFVSGYAPADIPEDLKFAVSLMVGMMNRKDDGGGPTPGFSFEGFSQSYGQDSPDDVTAVANIIAQHCKWIWAR